MDICQGLGLWKLLDGIQHLQTSLDRCWEYLNSCELNSLLTKDKLLWVLHYTVMRTELQVVTHLMEGTLKIHGTEQHIVNTISLVMYILHYKVI